MFCPSCGRENAQQQKYCAGCGTNLEAVSQALTGVRDDFFTKTDMALDQLIARYAEHIFKDAPTKSGERKVSNSWKILGQGVVTSLTDMVLFSLMWNILPLRFLILLITTPFRLLSQRANRQNRPAQRLPEPVQNQLSDSPPTPWLLGTIPSVSEHTTRNLEEKKRLQEQERH